MRQTLRISIHVQLTLLLNSTWPCVEVCYDDEEQRQEGKTFVCLSRRRLFWLVSFLRFAIPCCDFPHDELSWRKSWDDDLNLEVIQQLYILTASFAPEQKVNIQWNQSCQHDRRHLLSSRVSNEIQGIWNRIVRMRDISLLCWREGIGVPAEMRARVWSLLILMKHCTDSTSTRARERDSYN